MQMKTTEERVSMAGAATALVLHFLINLPDLIF